MKRLIILQIIAIFGLGLLIAITLINRQPVSLGQPDRVLAFEEASAEEVIPRTPLPTIIPTITPASPSVESPTAVTVFTPTQPPPTTTPLPTNPAAHLWKQWPSMPAFVSDSMRAVYKRGLENGNDAHAFSVLGDCQSQPDVFLGIYDRDPSFVNQLPFVLRPVVSQFRGSFDRYSPTVKDGTTEGSLLWMGWNDNKEGYCNAGESPLDCELRVHRPSIAFIHVGTHWENRNERYLTMIIEKLIENGTVPVIVTKADNRELDERINQTLVRMADQFELPVWNFWASAQPLENHGMLKGSTMYLSDEGLQIHQQEALEALYRVWQGLK